MADLLNVDDALRRILKRIPALPAERVPLAAAAGRTLAQDIVADVNLPPFANSSMDGFAVRAQDIANASANTPVTLQVTLDIPAGAAPGGTLHPGAAARIMTGAPLPDGADAIVPVEQTDARFDAAGAAPEQVRVFRPSKAGDYVRPIGEDVSAGQTVLRVGTVLRSPDVGLLAAVGIGQVPVTRQPRAAVLSSGDELADADTPLKPGQIRDVNGYTLSAAIREAGGVPLRLPIARDTLEDVRRLFRAALAQEPDMLVSSAGVSVGSFDLIRTVLAELGQVNFWKINLRPGKPLAFGELRGSSGAPIPFFGLPGNPVSALVTFDVLVRPALLKMQGRTDDTVTVDAVAGEDIHSDGRRSYLRVRLERDALGRLVAHTTGTQSSGALTSMVLADGLLIVPEDVTFAAAGTALRVRLLRWK